MIMHLTQKPVKRIFLCMGNKAKELRAEMEAINLWDSLLADNPHQLDIDAARARFHRRVQVALRLKQIASRN